jgi:hypothetical protein
LKIVMRRWRELMKAKSRRRVDRNRASIPLKSTSQNKLSCEKKITQKKKEPIAYLKILNRGGKCLFVCVWRKGS